jgi:hypothetical protein
MNSKKAHNLKKLYICILHYNIVVISNITINVDFVLIKMYLFLYYRTYFTRLDIIIKYIKAAFTQPLKCVKIGHYECLILK